MQDELINAMSNEDLQGLREKYADNESITTLIDGILQTRIKAQEQLEAKAKFEAGIHKLFAKLPHPEDVYNVYVRWGEVEVIDGEEVETEITNGDGTKTTEMRAPKHKEFQWIVEVNHATQVKSSGTTTPTTSKRAITVFKRNGTNLEDKGHFASATKACEALGLTIGGDSATRVLARDGYITEPYTGEITET